MGVMVFVIVTWDLLQHVDLRQALANDLDRLSDVLLRNDQRRSKAYTDLSTEVAS